MEAVAKHDFNATADDELSFRKGAVLKVTRLHTVWKFHDFSITQNLREIKFREFRSRKIEIFAIFGGYKFC